MIDIKIESIVNKLGVKRSQVHFLENYHDNSNAYMCNKFLIFKFYNKFFMNKNIFIDKKFNLVQIHYHCLKLLLECMKEGSIFIE